MVRESSNAKGRNGGQEGKAGACATIAKVDILDEKISVK